MGRPSSPYLPLRLAPLAMTVIMVAVAGLVAASGMRFTRTETLWIALPLLLGVANIVLVPSVGSTVRPVPLGASTEVARRISIGVLRTVTMLRLVLAEAPFLFGLIASVIAHSLVPLGIGIAFAIPLLLFYVYPSARVVEGIRLRLEAGGAASHLWEALGAPR